MPPLPLPPEYDDMLAVPNPAVVASLRPDGSPHTSATWYEWHAGRVLLNMDHARTRLRFMRADPRVSLTVLEREDWFRHLSLFGRIVEIRDNKGLHDIDRLAERYLGRSYPKRDRARVSAWMQVENWYRWDAHAEVNDLDDAGSLVGRRRDD